MFKNIVTFILLSMISTASMKVLAEINSVTKIGASSIGVTSKVGSNVKMHHTAPVIRLAMNDVTQLQDINSVNSGNRNSANKNSASDKTAVVLPIIELSKVPSQAWLILGALFCFVMRSSRRSI